MTNKKRDASLLMSGKTEGGACRLAGLDWAQILREALVLHEVEWIRMTRALKSYYIDSLYIPGRKDHRYAFTV